MFSGGVMCRSGYLQGKILGGTSQSTSTVVGISSVAIDLLTNIEREAEETNSRTLDRLDDILLHILSLLDVERDLLNVV
jgi:hypothetical protein